MYKKEVIKIWEKCSDQSTYRAQGNEIGEDRDGAKNDSEEHPHLGDWGEWQVSAWHQEVFQGKWTGKSESQHDGYKAEESRKRVQEWQRVSSVNASKGHSVCTKHSGYRKWVILRKCHLPTCQLSCGNVTHHLWFWFNKNDTNSPQTEIGSMLLASCYTSLRSASKLHAPDPGLWEQLQEVLPQNLTSEADEQLACSQGAQLRISPLFSVLAGTVCRCIWLQHGNIIIASLASDNIFSYKRLKLKWLSEFWCQRFF